MKNRKTIQIEWGDCDPAQIVYYPRYFAYFDACTTALFKKAGLIKREMLKTYRISRNPSGRPEGVIHRALTLLAGRDCRIGNHRVAAEQLLRPPQVVQ